MNMLTRIVMLKRARNQRGLTLLEYCAGAAVIAGTVFVAMNALGGSLSQAMAAIGTWAVERTANLPH